MSIPKPTRSKPAQIPETTGEMYRGIRLQPFSGRSQFTRDQIKQAVEAAIAKNAQALARKP
ncbi:MAG: hypothetical protein QOF90_3192 [Acetobacteraceae bacterium]|jgi:DNA invertase Pin-like site-specific DNA recombinase|nr:hypothetical protein [Acetobacteraceae bacterium]MEA2777786.1 hypothetical protein [Acetobacteraceae bacterium]